MKRIPQEQFDIKSKWRLYWANCFETINKTTSNTTGTSVKMNDKDMVIRADCKKRKS